MALGDLRMFDEEMEKKRKAASLEQAGPSMKGAGTGAMAGLKSGSAAEGALAGAMAAGPAGAIAGGALGLAKGLANQAKQKRQIESEKHKQIGRNIQKTAGDKNAAISKIMEGLRSAFIF